MALWSEQLAIAINAVLMERKDELSSQSLVMLAIDCHPWDGHLSFSVLTNEERYLFPELADPDEMAAWKYFDFPQNSASWMSTDLLKQEMKQAYFSASEQKETAIFYFHQCAYALNNSIINKALQHYRLCQDFKLSVSHPDTGQEFYHSNS